MSDDISSAFRLITPPDLEPLGLDQAKAFLRIEQTADDEAIAAAITVARQFAEQHLRTVFLPQVWEYSLANPATANVRLPIGPVQTIESVTLTDEAGTMTTMNTANYRLSVDGRHVLFTNRLNVEKLTVQFKAGLVATVAEIPAPIVQGMLHHIAVMIESRDGVVALPMQSIACYQPFRQVAV